MFVWVKRPDQPGPTFPCLLYRTHSRLKFAQPCYINRAGYVQATKSKRTMYAGRVVKIGKDLRPEVLSALESAMRRQFERDGKEDPASYGEEFTS